MVSNEYATTCYPITYDIHAWLQSSNEMNTIKQSLFTTDHVRSGNFRKGATNESHLKGQCLEIFCFWFFHGSVSPQPQSISLGPFQIFSKIRGDIRISRCTIRINDTTGGKLPAVANLPLVSTTPAANFATSFASVVDTGGKTWKQYQAADSLK